ncbi:hypothetical protein RB200_19575 [Streptomyces sp. PmtG]
MTRPEEQRRPRPNRILAEPATIQACATDYGTSPAAAGAARDQLAIARAHGNEHAATLRSHG